MAVARRDGDAPTPTPGVCASFVGGSWTPGVGEPFRLRDMATHGEALVARDELVEEVRTRL